MFIKITNYVKKRQQIPINIKDEVTTELEKPLKQVLIENLYSCSEKNFHFTNCGNSQQGFERFEQINSKKI